MARGDAAATVLIVDDDAPFRALIRHLVEAAGYDVVGEASNGAEAIRLAAELEPDLITMDLEMPVTSGVEATAAITERGSPSIVVVSGSLSSEQLGDALAAGARWHVPKREVAEQLLPVLAAMARVRLRA